MENPSAARQYTRKGWLRWMVPVVLAIIVTVITYLHSWIEAVYSIQIYPNLAMVLRTLLGWMPFSIGDILYFVAGCWLVYKIIKTIKDTIQRKITPQKTLRRTFKLVRLALWIYIIFNLIWGWNYHRKGLEHQLQLPTGSYSSSEVKQLLEEVIVKLNENRKQVSGDTILPDRTFDELKQQAAKSYEQAAHTFPFFKYSGVSIKKSMYSKAAEYFGFSGYYNPFTGEAQLRTHLPEVMKPFVLCHEVGHQVGYAKEYEASFAGYLAASYSSDAYFRYSVYLDLYTSIQSKLLFTSLEERDTTVISQLKNYNQQLDTLVRFDRRKIREFFRRNRTPLSENMSFAVMSMYEQYLKANAQTAGLKSYDDVVSLLIAFRRKYGRV